MNKTKCPICGSLIDDETYTDCPNCDWTYDGCEQLVEDEEIMEDNLNPVSIAEAKRLVAQGKNIWGDPLLNK